MKRPAKLGEMWLRQCDMINQTQDAISVLLLDAAHPADAEPGPVYDAWQLVWDQVRQAMRGSRRFR